jgi:hypothetical protein
LIFVIAMIKSKKSFQPQKSQSGQCGSKQTVEPKPRKKTGQVLQSRKSRKTKQLLFEAEPKSRITE